MRNASVSAFAAVITILLGWPVQAAEKKVVLDVKNADCALCAPIIKQSLVRVHGVKDVRLNKASRIAELMATVTFDDAVTDEIALIAATTNAGYPAHVARPN
jgi:periplasmic mercuric ion binding protein